MSSRGPLDGIRVLTIALNLPGPVAAARLVALGATVEKIEPPGGDPMQFAQGDVYAELHRGINVSSVDLKSPAGLEELLGRLATTDLFLASSRLGALERLGLGWSVLGERFPNLCEVAIVGYAPPEENHPGHDLTYQAIHGLVAPPSMPRTTLADLGGSLEAVAAALGLLLRRERAQGKLETSERQALVPLAEAAAFFAQPVRWGLTIPGGVLGGGLAQYNIYRCDTGWLALAALEPHFWVRLQASLGVENPTQEQLESIFLTQSAEAWEAWGQEKDLPLVAVRA